MNLLKKVFNANLSPSPGKGRWYEFIRQFFVLGEYRGGNLVGTDKAGNRYYEITNEKLMFPCKSRECVNIYNFLLLLYLSS